MSVPSLVARKVFTFFRIIFTALKALFWCCFRRPQSNIGELPYALSKEHRVAQMDDDADVVQAASDPSSNTWNAWDDRSFGVQSKIEEYRQQQQQARERERLLATQRQAAAGHFVPQSAMAAASVALPPAAAVVHNSEEEDLFNQLRPEFRPTKKLKLKVDAATTSRNLFDVRENEVYIPEAALGNDLGELPADISPTANQCRSPAAAADSWDAELDDVELDALEREQRRRERMAEREKRRFQQHQHNQAHSVQMHQ